MKQMHIAPAPRRRPAAEAVSSLVGRSPGACQPTSREQYVT